MMARLSSAATLAFALFAAAACARLPQPGSAEPSAAPEDSVWHAVLSFWARHRSSGHDTLFVVVAARGWSEAEAESWAESYARLTRGDVPVALLRAFVRANTQPVRATIPRSLHGKTLLPLSSLPRYGPGPLRYVLYVSRAGFSTGGDSALVHVSHTCSPLCGTSALVLAVRRREGWHVESELSMARH